MNPDNIQKLFGSFGINEATLHLEEGDFYYLAFPAEKSYLYSPEGSAPPSEFVAAHPFAPAHPFTPKELHLALRAENIQEATVYVDGHEHYYHAYTYNEFSYGPEGRPPQEFDITGEPGAAPHLAVEMANQRAVLA